MFDGDRETVAKPWDAFVTVIPEPIVRVKTAAASRSLGSLLTVMRRLAPTRFVGTPTSDVTERLNENVFPRYISRLNGVTATNLILTGKGDGGGLMAKELKRREL